MNRNSGIRCSCNSQMKKQLALTAVFSVGDIRAVAAVDGQSKVLNNDVSCKSIWHKRCSSVIHVRRFLW